MKYLITAAATGVWFGKAPFMPGTFGTASGVLLWCAISFFYESPLIKVALFLLTTFAGWKVTELYLQQTDADVEADPSEVVIDEWAGVYLTLTVVPLSSLGEILIAFCLFRFYDILKPWPVSCFDSLPGARGIMLDDLAAGLFALLTLLVLRLLCC